MRLLADRSAMDWLPDAWTGIDAVGWPAHTWILHAMHEPADTPSGRRRLRRAELARRTGVDPFREGILPSFRAFRPWPPGVDGPREGRLDRVQYRRLIDVLASSSPQLDATPCFVYYAGCWDFDTSYLSSGTLREAAAQYDDPPTRRDDAAPNDLWPTDRSWFASTLYDLCGTKVSGDARTIAMLEADAVLETARLSP